MHSKSKHGYLAKIYPFHSQKTEQALKPFDFLLYQSGEKNHRTVDLRVSKISNFSPPFLVQKNGIVER